MISYESKIKSETLSKYFHLKSIKSKKVRCDKCGFLVQYSELRNVLSNPIDRLMVCEKCYYY